MVDPWDVIEEALERARASAEYPTRAVVWVRELAGRLLEGGDATLDEVRDAVPGLLAAAKEVLAVDSMATDATLLEHVRADDDGWAWEIADRWLRERRAHQEREGGQLRLALPEPPPRDGWTGGFGEEFGEEASGDYLVNGHKHEPSPDDLDRLRELFADLAYGDA